MIKRLPNSKLFIFLILVNSACTYAGEILSNEIYLNREAYFDKVRKLIYEISLSNFIMVGSADLNGDGKKEKISISGVTNLGDFVLQVDRVFIKGKLCDRTNGFTIVDIDTNDKYKEIAVHTHGPSDDDEYLIYWYDGKSIKEMGKLWRWPKFFGNGKVLVKDWMGFWLRTKKYILTKERTLKLVPQEFYFVGVGGTVTKSLPILEERNGKEVVANLRVGSKVLIVLCDTSPEDYGDYWYLIKSDTNILGWVKQRDVYDYLEGLPMAD